MKLGGNREVEAIIFAGIQPPQELQALLQLPILCPHCVCTAQRQVMYRTRPGLSASELRDSGGEILVDGDLDARLGRRHNPQCVTQVEHLSQCGPDPNPGGVGDPRPPLSV